LSFQVPFGLIWEDITGQSKFSTIMVSPFPVDPVDDSKKPSQRELINLAKGFTGTWRISS